jgi:transposase
VAAGSGAKIIASAEQVRQIAETLLHSHPEHLIERVVEQACRIGELYSQIAVQQHALAEQQQVIEKLQEQLATAQREGKRQAAPFRIAPEKRHPQPHRPGRKAGHAGAWRQPPPVQASDEHIEVRLTTCPHCGSGLEGSEQQAIEQTIVEVPQVPPRIIRLRTYRQSCPCCQQSVASSHPVQVSTAIGAAGTQLGARAIGIASSLNKQMGLPLRKTAQVMQRLLGVQVTPGGLSQTMQRAAHRLQPDYEQLQQQLQHSAALYSDETGWWVGEPGYWLWVLTNEQGTYYHITSSRSRDTARQLIGEHYGGVLVSDCLAIYDDLNPLQHKCYAHHLKALSDTLQMPEAKGSLYLLELRALLKTALVLKHIQSDIHPERACTLRHLLEQRIDQLLAPARGDPEHPLSLPEDKFRLRLLKQRDHLFTFLDHPQVEGTNNRAERQLRPAIVSRKISCGNKTQAGAETWQILASWAATCQQQDESFIVRVAEAMRLSPWNGANDS